MSKSMFACFFLFISSLLHAAVSLDQQVGSIETFEVPYTQVVSGNLDGGIEGGGDRPQPTPTLTDRIESTGKIISSARDVVALGEAVYDLVKKGKPSNVTEYAPISVLPKDPATKEAVDLFDMEGFSMPVRRKFVAIIKDKKKKPAIRFEYMLIYSYGGSYNGTGKYIIGAQIIPISVQTKFGWDFTATMRLAGIMNHGTKASPIAGAILAVKYQMNSWSLSYERNDTLHITGAGKLTTYFQEMNK